MRLHPEPGPAQAAARASAASFAALEACLDYLGSADVEQVRRAYRLADEAHLGQMRKNGDPYITHPIAVAQICTEWKLDAQALSAALLHDVMDGTAASARPTWSSASAPRWPSWSTD